MNTRVLDDLPACLKTPDTFVGMSNNSIVIGYKDQHILAKFDRKSKERNYAQRRRARARVQIERRERHRIQEELQPYSNSPDIVPCIDVVIHNGQNGDITYSEIQEWFQGSQTLADAGWSLLSSRREILEDLRLIFASSIHHYRRTRDLYDIQGTVLELGPVKKVVSALFPLFSSTNIIIDRDNHVRFVDADMLKGKSMPLRTWLHRQVKMTGILLSIGLLDVAIFANKARPGRERRFS